MLTGWDYDLSRCKILHAIGPDFPDSIQMLQANHVIAVHDGD